MSIDPSRLNLLAVLITPMLSRNTEYPVQREKRGKLRRGDFDRSVEDVGLGFGVRWSSQALLNSLLD